MSTNTGAAPRDSGYTTLSSARAYAVASNPKYASSNAAEAAIHGQASPDTDPNASANGASSTTPAQSATAVAA
jgi:hypothetical protein